MYKTYVLYFEVNNYDYLITVKSGLEETMKKFTIKDRINGCYYFQIGWLVEDISFEGYLGPVLVFNTIFDDEFKKNLFALKCNYLQVFYVGKYELSANYYKQQNREIVENNNFQSDYALSINYFYEYRNISDNIKICVIPKISTTPIKKHYYTNRLFKETKIYFNNIPNVDNGNIFMVKNKLSLYEFLKFDGTYFIILNFELVTAMLNSLSEDILHKNIDYIIKYFCSIVYLSRYITMQIRIDTFEEDINKIFFAFWKALRKVSIYLNFIYVILLN